MKKNLIASAVILLVMLSCAIESQALTIGPGRLEVRLPPGEVAGADYYCQNDTESSIRVVVEPENWAMDAYDYRGLAVEDWIKLDCYEFDLKPKEIKKLKLTVKVPKNAKGELVAQIFFTSAAEGPSIDAVGAVRARLGAILYVAIKGTETANIEINDIVVSNISDENKLKLDVPVRNNGNVHIRPNSGQVLIEDERGRRVALLNLNTGYAVLPGKDYIYSVSWDKPTLGTLGKGKYRVYTVIKYGKMYGREKTAKFEKIIEVDKEGKVLAK